MTRSVVVWFPDWPVIAAGVAADVPAAVFHANRVVACSEAARQSGVRRGLRRREAQAGCPELVVLPLDRDTEVRAFEPVVALLEQICPRVEITRPGLVAFAARGPSRYFGGDDALSRHVLANVPGPCRVGVADDAFAAGLAARSADSAGGYLVIAPGESAAFLAPMSVDALDRPELADLLRRLGIRTLGEFAALPAPRVLARFGPEGAALHRRARGEGIRPLETRTPPVDLAVQAELDPPAERVDVAAFTAKALADRLQHELRSRALMCSGIVIEAETEHGERLERVWRHDGQLTAAGVAERVRWQLDGWLNGSAASRPTGGISLLRLVPEEIHADQGRQPAFWGGTTLADERAARGLARLQGVLGPDAVRMPVLVGGRGPGERVALVPWGDAKPATVGAPWPGAVPAPAPAVVHGEPPPADVVDAAGATVTVTGRAMVSAAPTRVRIGRGRWADIEAWAGPWPADERWWDPPAHRRRARLQIVAATGAAYLLVVEGGRWWVEATYD